MRKKYLNELTIIITTYNRPKFLIRSIQYWKDKNIKIIYLDGSKKRIDLNITNKLNSNIKYIHKPVSQYERILSIIDIVETNYVMFGSDDEFYITSALNSCITELKKDKDLVACGGVCHAFNFKKNKILGYFKYPKLISVNLNQKNADDRIKNHFYNYVPAHIYSVCKTSTWKTISSGIFSKEYNFYSAFEFQIEFLFVYAGKSKVIPELMWLRSYENNPIKNVSPQLMNNNRIENWWYRKNSIYKHEYNDFLTRMNDICQNLDKSKKKKYQTTQKNIEIAFNGLMKLNKKINFFFSNYLFLNYFFIKIKKTKILIKFLSNLFNYLINKNMDNNEFDKQIIYLSKNKIYIDYNELNKIKLLINNFHKNKIN